MGWGMWFIPLLIILAVYFLVRNNLQAKGGQNTETPIEIFFSSLHQPRHYFFCGMREKKDDSVCGAELFHAKAQRCKEIIQFRIKSLRTWRLCVNHCFLADFQFFKALLNYINSIYLAEISLC